MNDTFASMENHGETAADVITGGVVARAVEPAAGEALEQHSHGNCRNCGAVLTGAYCSNCGQSSHLHRSLLSLGHDILHGVFHFEGKVWRTLPELFFRPGRLTRRYIDGERARFVSPMALYLFAVFLMFAVFSFTGGSSLSLPEGADVLGIRQEWKENIADDIEELNDKIEAQQERLAEPDLTGAAREREQEVLAGLIATREAMETMISGDMNRIAEFFETQERRARERAATAASDTAAQDTANRFESAIKQASTNPALLAYKLKTAGYKYSWALVPLSVPFLWLLFFWRRDIHLYDHAIFITYSISFMMLFVVMLSVAASLGVSGALWGIALVVIPPIHLYKQLRAAYGLSRFGTWIRLFMLLIMILFVLILFSTLLLALGVSG
ncbi:MAG TPA: DUF3667 domain-containing protein [Steroidobacter sp.]|uniref:DUF3667 domain-containing protein n=1 Tax=Steroidobacter sp. TaxID=1978227 RepID=UPI002EDA0375